MSLGQGQGAESPTAMSMSETSVGVTFIHGSDERERDALSRELEEESNRPNGRSPSTPSDDVGEYDHETNEAEGSVKRLDKMNGRALLLHLRAQGMPDVGIDTLQSMEFNGRKWVDYIGVDPTGARDALREELGMESGLRIQIILSEGIKVNELIQREERQSEEDREEQRQLRLMNVTLSTPTKEGSRDSAATSPEKTSAEVEVDRIRADLCPKIGIYAQVDGFPTSIQLKVLKVEISGWVETHSGTLADVIREAMTAGGATVEVLFTQLDDRDIRLDAKLGGYIYMTPNDKIKRHFLDDSIRMHEGKTSAVKLLFEVQKYVNYQSSARTKLMTTNFLSQPPVSDSRLLLKKAIEFEENCDIMTDVGGIDPNIAGLAVNVLDNLVSKLVADSAWNQLLSIPLGMVKHHNPNEFSC